MKIYLVPMDISGFYDDNVAIRLRRGEKPALFMQNVQVTRDGRHVNRGYEYGMQNTSISVFGDMEKDVSLQDDDVLLIHANTNPLDESIEVHVEEKDGAYISEGMAFNPVCIAFHMESHLCVCIADEEHKNTISTGMQILNKAMELYKAYPAFKSIMIKDAEGVTKEISILELISMQDEKFCKWSETMILSMDEKYKTQFPVAKQILEQSATDNGFMLLSKEEQVAAFLEFSRMHADKATEIVSDELIDFIRESSEYGKSLEKLKQAGYGESATQQFNVLQQVGYFGGSVRDVDKGNVIYNLSDMGAGKTLMTVQAIFTIDCIHIGVWNRSQKNEFVNVNTVYLPDKHIIAPALSVKSSWVDTFRLFYDVEKKDDYHYVLKAEFDGTEAYSDLYIAPFTVRGGKIFVHAKLPDPTSYETYLIVDEIHQLVHRRISRTKFFVPKLTPVNTYRIFALSGTMSNLQSGEWLSLIRFLGDTSILKSAKDSQNSTIDMDNQYKNDIKTVAKDLETLQHKKFNVENITPENRYMPAIKDKTAVDLCYFMRYGTKLIIPSSAADNVNVKDMLTEGSYHINVEPEECDNVSFELFYLIAASSAITAQSLQIAEELFGEQATQHKSSIIRTMSPFTDEEIMLLDTLHKIAADANKYRSPNIGREINNAILNLNDGLQQKNLYDLISGFAEKNNRFLEYLAMLDVNVLERLPKTGLIQSPKLEETQKFHVLNELLEKDRDETFLIVVNDFYAMKTLAEALGVDYLSKQELKDEMSYQELLDGLFEKQNIVIVTQDMIKSSLDLVQANRLIQYQLNTEVSDIIQTQNRINRIGQTRETRCFYIAADRLQNALIELFLNSYRNIRVAHKGIVELFADLSSQIDVINDYLNVAFKKLETEKDDSTEENQENQQPQEVRSLQEVQDGNNTDLVNAKPIAVPKNIKLADNGICNAILFPEKEGIGVIVPLKNGNPFRIGTLKPGIIAAITAPTRAVWNLDEMKLVM